MVHLLSQCSRTLIIIYMLLPQHQALHPSSTSSTWTWLGVISTHCPNTHLSDQTTARLPTYHTVHLRIAHIVHDYLRFPFPFHSGLLSLHIALFGFSFPGISRLNASAAVMGLQCDLDHPIDAFPTMAQITLTDSCMLNGCRYPLARSSRHQSFVRAHERLPWAWILARQTLLDVNCSIVPIDQSHLIEGHVSIRHILNSSPRLVSSFPSAASPALTRHGFTQLSRFGSWSAQNTASQFRFEPSHNLTTALSTAALSLRRHLPTLASKSLPHLSLNNVLLLPRTHQCSHHQHHFPGSLSYFCSCNT